MQWNVTPMADDTGARLPPRVTSLPRQVVPVKRLRVKFAFGPAWKRIHHVALAHVFPSVAWAISWFREFVFKSLVGTHSHQKDSSAILRDAITLRIQHGPFHSVTGRTVADQLIAQ